MANRSHPYLDGAVLDNGVALVTCAHADRRNIMTASFFAESSHVPALVRLSVASASWTHELINASGWFGLSMLSREQAELAIDCGTSSGRNGCKFERHGFRCQTDQLSPVPLLLDCLTTSSCRVVERVELPGHTLFVGRVVTSLRQSACAHRSVLLVSDLINHLNGQ